MASDADLALSKLSPEFGPVVIEVNDNPSLDSDEEEQVLGEELCLRQIGEFVERLDRCGAGN